MRLGEERQVDFVQGDYRSGVLQWRTEAGLNSEHSEKWGKWGSVDGHFQEETSGKGVGLD